MRKKYDKDLIAELYLQGVEYADIAERAGVSRAAVYNVVNERGLPRRRVLNVAADEIMDLHKQGFTMEEIKQRTGAGIDRINIILAEPVEEEDMSNLTYAPEQKPVHEIVIYKGKRYLDVTREFVQ